MDRYDSFDLKPGDVLAGKFRIEEVLGVGGMGLVASARHLELGTRVALKVLLPSALVDEDAVERFSREASAVSKMRSEYVVRVFDVGKLPDGGPPYLVMEHLDGEDLATLMARRGPLEIAEAVDYVTQACEGIAEAHSLGVIHRDLKPANLFLTRRVDGSKLLKVVDFGIAKHRLAAGSTTLTGPLVTMGSPQYMSPEQTRAAQDLGATTDVWSLGVCLYEMLTGMTPFAALSVADVTALVLMTEPQPPERLRPDIPPRLSEIVMRCLAKRPWERFADVGAMTEALEPFAPESRAGAARRIRRVLLRAHAPLAERAGPTATAESLDVAPESMARPDQDLAVPLRAPRLTLATAPDLEASPAPTPRRAVPAWLVPLSVVTAVVVLGLVVALWRSRARTAEPALAQVSSNEPSVPSSTVSPVETAERPIAIQVPTARPMTTTPPTRSPTLPAPSPRGPELASARAPALPVLPPTPPAPTPSTTAPPPPDAPAIAPSFVLASARVEVGTATNTIGTTATNVNRAIAPLTDRMTACYRAALPQMHEPFAGTGTLHIETDEDGVITVARVLGNITAPATCIAAAASGRRLANVDTGRARADVPVSFKAR